MYEKLEKIQELLWKNDDLMDQDTLFELQDKVAELILEVAGKEGRKRLTVWSRNSRGCTQ